MIVKFINRIRVIFYMSIQGTGKKTVRFSDDTKNTDGKIHNEPPPPAQ